MMLFLSDLKELQTPEEFSDFAKQNFVEIQKGFYSPESANYVYEFDEIFQNLIINDCINNVLNESHVIAFLELTADFTELHNLNFSINELAGLLPDSATKHRLIGVYRFISEMSLTSFDFFADKLKRSNMYYEDNYKISLSYIDKVIYVLSIYHTNNETANFNNLHSHIINNHSLNNIIEPSFIDTVQQISYLNFSRKKADAHALIEQYLSKHKHVSYSAPKIALTDISYTERIRNSKISSFQDILRISTNYFSGKRDLVNTLFVELSRGIDIIENSELLNLYLFAYGNMHYHKVFEALDTFMHQIDNKTIEVIDWGCGQGLASVTLIDYIKKKNIKVNIEKIHLTEPSGIAINRAELHIKAISDGNISIKKVKKDMDSLQKSDLITNNNVTKIHLFSNVLDVPFFDLKQLYNLFAASQQNLNYIVAVSPHINYSRNLRLDYFFNYFDQMYNSTLISKRENTKTADKWKSNYCKCENYSTKHFNHSLKCQKAWTRYERIFKVNI